MVSGLLFAAIAGWLAAVGVFAYSRSVYHQAKAEVYQEFADTYSRMNVEGLFRSPKEQRRAMSKRLHMSLVLCDPRVRDGLADALAEADQHWTRIPFMDGERGDPR
jgi:hypothetical protein